MTKFKFKFSRKNLLIMACIISLLVALLFYNYMDGIQNTHNEDVTVVVAKIEILPNVKLTVDMIEQIRVPSELLQSGAVTDIKSVLGTYTKTHINAHEQITDRLVRLEGKDVGFTGVIPNDKRAVSVSVNDITGVAGLIKPGNYVDVIITLNSDKEEPMANMTFQNILVLAVNKNTDSGDKESAVKQKEDKEKIEVITVAVTPDEAIKLALAEVKGSILFALRPYSPIDGGYIFVGTKTLSHLKGNSSLFSPAPTYPTSIQSAPYQPEVITPVAITRVEQEPAKTSITSGKSISVIRGTQVESVYVK